MGFYEIILVSLIAFGASLLTFFSGFGLGTLLTPAIMLFLPVELAIAATAVVHFLNNIFKLLLTRNYINKKIIRQFGVPAIVGAMIGAFALGFIGDTQTLATWQYGAHKFEITWLKVIVGVIMIVFAIIELVPKLSSLSFSDRYLFPGGLACGFYGGLSGHQGALRSMFLLRAKLSKEEYIASGVAIACIVDVTRILVYSKTPAFRDLDAHVPMLTSAILAAFGGALLGKRFLHKITIEFVQKIVGILLIVLALVLISGII